MKSEQIDSGNKDQGNMTPAVNFSTGTSIVKTSGMKEQRIYMPMKSGWIIDVRNGSM